MYLDKRYLLKFKFTMKQSAITSFSYKTAFYFVVAVVFNIKNTQFRNILFPNLLKCRMIIR